MQDGTYEVLVRVKDDDGTWSNGGAAGNPSFHATTITVTNVAPTITSGPEMWIDGAKVCEFGGAACTVPEGTEVEFRVAVADVGADDTFGDGSAFQWDFGETFFGVGQFARGALGSANSHPEHIFDDDTEGQEAYAVVFTVQDSDRATATRTLPVAVTNVAPTVTAASQTAAPADEGDSDAGTNPATFSVTVYDPSDEDCERLRIYWDFDTTVNSDGQGGADDDEDYGTGPLGAGVTCGVRSTAAKSDNSRTHTSSHTYDQDDDLGTGDGLPYHLRVWVEDDEGATGHDSSVRARVDNVDPVVAGINNKPASEQDGTRIPGGQTAASRA